ncbi:helix-turn-helix domain-containing protein [Chitinophaga sp. GCM10012297]|uniref:Helix-turn-helix transcriptional regulator n=1 Tax=Chitinophaga chungangae TaxID=2821488 RepID=A0ABS3YIM0_9BACT|nr:helix-turn-helix domain-containing protein [Chitinophaga chungangae]MBO9154536.1 helix-turn-helix transcriptional regulator [Chitinophaga chungangae]
MKAQNLIQDTHTAAAMMHPLRMRILEQLREPNSAAGLSRLLNMPRQQLNYHLRELEKNELIELVEERKKGNCTERIVRATSRSYMVLLNSGGVEADEIGDKFSSSYLLHTAGRMMQDVAAMQSGAHRAKKKLATFTLETEVRFADPSQLQAFTDEMAQTIARLAMKYHQPGNAHARPYQFRLFAHPSKKQDHEKRNES